MKRRDSTPQTLFGMFGVETLLSAEDSDVRARTQQYVDERIRPNIGAWFESESTPVRDVMRELGALGLLGMHLDGYGCAGSSATAYGMACLELEAGDSGIRTLVSVQGSLAMHAIWKWGSVAQKEEWLPRMARGEAIGCFGVTEPDFGSDPGGMRTFARRDGDDWVLTGSKKWISLASVADVAIIWARTDDRIRGFVVPTDTPGFTARDIHGKLSLRAAPTGEITMQDVRLPASAVLPDAQGLSGPLACLNAARFGIIFGALGAARDCIESTVEYSLGREIFDKPLAGYQTTQTKLADMAVEFGKAIILALHFGRLVDSGSLLRPEQVSAGKLNSVRTALAIARECRTILGANGVSLAYPALRHANNLESVLTYEGTSEVHQLIIGQSLTGLAAFR
ncbi:acyl-CoA dehydrogenase family protein [Microbacterium sp. RD1]|uniref:acyl-CoA dehydrogenase family protein n=1 Tax=Microbacterium sp. RD1 TaxID=3457313 RepID=UPI003FA59287